MNRKNIGLRKGIDFTTLLQRLLILYIAWFLCRIVFYIQNSDLIGPLSWSEIPTLLLGGLVFDNVSILYVNSLFIILSLLPFHFREKEIYQKILFWLYIITNSASLILNLSDGVYFHYVGKRFTSDELTYLDTNDNNSAIIFKAMTENWYLVLFCILLIWGIVWCYRHIKYTPTKIANKWTYFGVNLLIMLAGITLAIGGIRGGFGSSRPLTLSNATIYTSSNLKATLILSNPFCMLRTLDNNPLVQANYFDQETVASIYTPYHYPAQTDSTVKATAPVLGKKNIVIFVLESFSSEHSALLNPDLYPDGKGFTPFLDSLMREGYYFQNTFASGHKSIDALPSVLASIPSYLTPFVLMPQSISKMRALPEILGEMGYTSSFFNGSPHGSMGFGAFTNLIGVKDYYSMDDYEKERGKNDYDGWWGIWDGPFLQYMSNKLSETPQPFLASVFTLTSHHPFRVPKEYENILPQGKTKIHKCVAYTDMSIRQFMETSSKEDWYKNTIFVFVGDHVSSETFAPKTHTSSGGIHIFGFMYTPDGSLKGSQTAPFSQMDIMPTLLGLVGNETPYFAFGRDVFNEPERMAIATNVIGNEFLGITDSLTIHFNGETITKAFNRNDTLEQNNLVGQNSEYMKRVENELKARIQQYYDHVQKGDYMVK